MSTAKLAFSPEDIEWLIKETQEDLALTTLGDAGRDAGICPYVTFYVYHQAEEYLTLADKFIAIWHEFQAIMDKPFRKLFKSRTQVWLRAGDKRFPADLHAEVKFLEEKYRSFYLMGTDMDSPDESPRWSYSASVTHVPEQGYSRLKLTFRRQWYVDNHQQQWKDFIHACVTSLQPEQCYMGFEVGNGGLSVMGAYETDVLERICADHFYGMDIDHPSDMGFQYHSEHHDGFVDTETLGSGLRPPPGVSYSRPSGSASWAKMKHRSAPNWTTHVSVSPPSPMPPTRSIPTAPTACGSNWANSTCTRSKTGCPICSSKPTA